jgi:phosphodiesterase/alkaline phosphatase D-like protein
VGSAPTRSRSAVRIDGAVEAVRAIASADGRTWASESVVPSAAGIARMRLDGLEPDTRYELSVEIDGDLDEGRGRGSFATTPTGAATFRFVTSSCAQTGSNGSVFDSIRAEEPAFFLHLGDLHYSNIARNEPERFRAAFDRVLTSPAQAALYREVPVEYVWDDHDYGPNDADASSPAREAARAVFREAVPSHRLESADGAIHRAFTIGRVRFVITDTRSERTASTMLGSEQLEWFEAELLASSRDHALVVWINPTPWIGSATPGSDAWPGFPDERRRIADIVADAGIDNLLMISADAHMIAYDDGTNSDYSSAGSGGGFPVFHAAALDRPGSVKGGPFTGGTFPGGGQYGVVDIADDGDAVTVTLIGKTWDGQILLAEELRFGPAR